jgi:hypothetical protein
VDIARDVRAGRRNARRETERQRDCCDDVLVVAPYCRRDDERM